MVELSDTTKIGFGVVQGKARQSDFFRHKMLTIHEDLRRLATAATTGESDLAALDTRIDALEGAASGFSVYDRVVATTTNANSSAEQTLYSKSIAGGVLGTTHQLRLTAFGDYLNNAGGGRNLTLRLKYGATTMLTTDSMNILDASERRKWKLEVLLMSAGATNAQRVSGDWQLSDNVAENWGQGQGTTIDLRTGYGTAAVDSTTAQTLAFTSQHSAASATLDIRIHGAFLELA